MELINLCKGLSHATVHLVTPLADESTAQYSSGGARCVIYNDFETAREHTELKTPFVSKSSGGNRWSSKQEISSSSEPGDINFGKFPITFFACLSRTFHLIEPSLYGAFDLRLGDRLSECHCQIR